MLRLVRHRGRLPAVSFLHFVSVALYFSHNLRKEIHYVVKRTNKSHKHENPNPVFDNTHWSDSILSSIDYTGCIMGPPCTLNMFSASPYYAVSFFLWDFNTFPRFSLLLWQQQWAECSVRYHLCCITSGDWKWHSMIPESLMADGTAEEGQEERGEEVQMWIGLAAGTHPSGTIMTGASTALGWNGCDYSVMARKEPCGLKKNTQWRKDIHRLDKSCSGHLLMM